jgi:hypothetical protein
LINDLYAITSVTLNVGSLPISAEIDARRAVEAHIGLRNRPSGAGGASSARQAPRVSWGTHTSGQADLISAIARNRYLRKLPIRGEPGPECGGKHGGEIWRARLSAPPAVRYPGCCHTIQGIEAEMPKPPRITLEPKGNDFVLQRTSAAGRTISITLSKDDILTLSQSIPSLRDHILAGQSPGEEGNFLSSR